MKFLTAIFVCLAIPLFGATTNLPISQLPSVTAIASSDLFLITINPGTSPASRKATLTSVNNSLKALNVTPLPSTNGTARALRLEDDLTIGTSIRVTNAATGEFWDYTASGTNAFARLKDVTNHVGSITIGSLGAGTSLVGTPAGLAFKLLSIIPGLNVTITNNNDQIGISTAQTGETNLLGSVGTGTSIAGTKSGVTLNVKSIAAGNAYLNIGSDSATLTLAPTNLVTLDSAQSITGRKQLQDTTGTLLDLGNQSGTVTVPWTTNIVSLIAVGDVAYQFSGGAPVFGEVAIRNLLFYQDGTGGRLITVGGTNIVVNLAASSLTVVSFLTRNGGTNIIYWSTQPSSGGGETNGFYVLIQATNALPNSVVITKLTNSSIELRMKDCYLSTTSPALLDRGSNLVDRLLFDDSTVTAARWDLNLPIDYGSGAGLVCTYSMLAGSASKTNVWGFQTQVISMVSSNNIDVDNWGTMIYITNVIPTMNSVATNFTVNLGITGSPHDKLRLRMTREGTNTMNNAPGKAALRGLNFFYTRL